MQEISSKILFLPLLLLFFLNFSLSTENPQQEEEIYYCGNTQIPNQSNLITCKYGKLYLKTSSALIHVPSSIDYSTKISHFSKVKLGPRVSMEVEGHMPDLCIACERPDGNCGVALRCLCHPKECKNKVVNFGTKSRALSGNIQHFLPLLSMALFLICF